MNAHELVKFLKLMYNTGCLDGYWKARLAEVLKRMGSEV